MKKVLCIYHADCLDGFGAAMVVWLWARGNDRKVELIPCHYGGESPDVAGHEVFIVDFSFPRELLIDLHRDAKLLTVIDHHKTAQEALKGLHYCIFDMEKSGAVLTWEFLFPDKDVPRLLRYIQDRDLWRFEMAYTEAATKALRLLDTKPEVWERYFFEETALTELIKRGFTLHERDTKKVESIVAAWRAKPVYATIGGYRVPCVNATELVSEIGHELCQGERFSASYFDADGERIYSLRSAEDGYDVSAIAKLYGGGGHQHAAGFKVPLECGKGWLPSP